MARTKTPQRGFFHDPSADPQQYIFGASPIAAPVLRTDGQWDAFLPAVEYQFRADVDSMSCATFHTLNPIEIILAALFNVRENYSDRFTAKVAGTTKQGADPHHVAECIRKTGLVPEAEWPFSDSIKTFEEYHATLPARLYEIGRRWLGQWDFKHDTVRGTFAPLHEEMKDALQYSPLGVSVGYNGTDENGYWYRIAPGPDGHWVTCYGYVEGKYWKIFDSYDETHKKVRWHDFQPQLVKRYAITKHVASTVELGILVQILTAIRDWWLDYRVAHPLEAPKQPPEAPKPTELPSVPSTRLYDAAKARIGQDLSNKAPNERGCAESLSRVIADVIASFPIHLSTITLQEALLKHPRFKQVSSPTIGAVSIFATKGKSVGHCGVVGLTHVMSNTSKTGKWEPNYTHREWDAAAKKRGLQIVNFILV